MNILCSGQYLGLTGKLNKILENLGKCLYSLSGHLLCKQIFAYKVSLVFQKKMYA